MKLNYILKLSINNLARNKTKTALTSLGIIIGVSSVIIIVGLSNSANEVVKKKIFNFGTNTIRYQAEENGSVNSRDIDEINKLYAGFIKYITPMNRKYLKVRYKGKTLKEVELRATDDTYFKIQEWFTTKGRLFNTVDLAARDKVVVIGSSIDEKLDPFKSMVNKNIILNNISYKVIGTLAKKGMGFSGADFDYVVIVPITSAEQKLFKPRIYEELYITVKNKTQLDTVKEGVRQYFRKKNNLLPTQKEDFELTTSEERLLLGTYITRILAMLMVSVASISLFVGGLGIMNIMLATVNERVKEIGIRMAIGAKEIDIMMQFLTESFSISAAGGFVGIVFGMLVYGIIVIVLKWPFIFSFLSIFISFFFAAAVGIFFGFYPAKQASKLKPIDALRHE